MTNDLFILRYLLICNKNTRITFYLYLKLIMAIYFHQNVSCLFSSHLIVTCLDKSVLMLFKVQTIVFVDFIREESLLPTSKFTLQVTKYLIIINSTKSILPEIDQTLNFHYVMEIDSFQYCTDPKCFPICFE